MFADEYLNLGISNKTWLKVLLVVNDPRQEKEKQDQMASNLDFLKQNNAVPDGDCNDNGQGR
ncbi:hypothetical protein ACXHYR_04795 [Ligilactobacillus salivarius]